MGTLIPRSYLEPMRRSGRRLERSVRADDEHARKEARSSLPALPPLLPLCFPYQIFIKDVKSSNGTFVNGERLSSEGLESEPYELKSDDHVVSSSSLPSLLSSALTSSSASQEFGIDIVGDDNKTVVHHKVSSKAFCIFNQGDVEQSLR
jgi:hypothetical protein